jgi:hypothetical protein
MVDHYEKFATENLAFAASRIKLGREGGNVIPLSRFCHVPETEKPLTEMLVAWRLAPQS